MRTFRRTAGEPFRVGSVTAMATMNACERRFWHQYRAETPKDHDYVIPRYFLFGGAFQKVLEWTRHEPAAWTPEMTRRACDEAGLYWDSEGAKVEACLKAYFAKTNKVEIIAIEEEVIVDNWVIYVDFVCRDIPHPERPNERPWWYIGDNKTTGMKFDPVIRTKLTVDPQMMSYSRFASSIIAERYKLPMSEYFGIMYRETEKPRKKYKQGETHEEFVERCGDCDYREVILSHRQFRDQQVIENISTQLARAASFEKEEDTIQDMRTCVDKGHRCAWYSQCYGKTYSQALFEGKDDEDKF